MTDTKENTSWSNNVIINMLDSVPNYEECQTLCQVTRPNVYKCDWVSIEILSMFIFCWSYVSLLLVSLHMVF